MSALSAKQQLDIFNTGVAYKCVPMEPAERPPSSPTHGPIQGWPTVPSPKDAAARDLHGHLQRQVRVAISPRSAALVRAEAKKKGNKFVPTGGLVNPLLPIVPPFPSAPPAPRAFGPAMFAY